MFFTLSTCCFSASHTITIDAWGASTNSLTVNAGDDVTFQLSGNYNISYDFTQNFSPKFSFTLNTSNTSYTHTFSAWDSGWFNGEPDPLGSFHIIDILVMSSVGVTQYQMESIQYYFQKNILKLEFPAPTSNRFEYCLLNINGQKIIDKTAIISTLTSVDLSSSTSGLFLLLIFNDGELMKKEKLIYTRK